MDIVWKQQHFNNSCASACVAMLLSQYGIDKQDDDIITETMMPYRIQHHPEEGGYFTAGVLTESAEVFTSMLLRNHLMLSNIKTRSWAEFEKTAAGLLAKGLPFMAGIPKQHEAGRKHAVVFYGVAGDGYLILDPSGGLERNQEHQYQAVRDKVDLRLPKGEMVEAFGTPDYVCSMGHLSEWNGDRGMPVTEVLKQSREALDAFGAKADQFKHDITSSIPAKHAGILYSCLSRVFKPVALDWRTAVEAQKARGKPQYQLIERLYTLQDVIMRQQKKLDQAPGIEPDFCDELSAAATAIIVAGKEHLSTAHIIT